MTSGWRRVFRSWTLRTKLVASMIALFAVVTVATGASIVVTLDHYLTATMDQSLTASLQRPPTDLVDGVDPDQVARGGPGDAGLTATLRNGNPQGFATSTSGTRVSLTSAQLALLATIPLKATPVELDLGPDLGQYRVMGVATPDGDIHVVGLSEAPKHRTIAALTVTVSLGILAGLVIVWLLGTYLVRRNLRPLQRVAATATRVSTLPLSSGEVALPERVSAADTDTHTEVGQVGAALNGLLDHVDNALNARHRSEQRVRQFVADASHELRTPLASIRGYAELSRRQREPVPETVSHAMGRIESEATRMSSLVEDLLLLARLDSGRPLESKPVDLTELVVDAVSDAHVAAPTHRFELDVPEEPVEVVGDQGRLHQVVANLLGNARTHTPPGTTVRTGVAREDGWVRVSVTDNGPGVPTALQPHVFERFARGDSSRNRAGGSTGLGLSIVSAVVQAHGGQVELHSRLAEPHEGRPGETTFSILLPIGSTNL